MKILVLMGQRQCRHDGQYAPEALACIDEYGDSENPDYLDGERLAAENSGDFDRLTVVTLDVSSDAIMAALYPEKAPIPATVVCD